MFNFEKPIFPAIAIPVQTKTEQYFECPRTHLACLSEMLPRIRKILIIGWQAREAHFSQMLQLRLPMLRHVMVVGRDSLDAGEILKYFQQEIRYEVPSLYVGQGGFTQFIVNQEGHSFLKA